jgi:putative SOS response-associated peptidase YedK
MLSSKSNSRSTFAGGTILIGKGNRLCGRITLRVSPVELRDIFEVVRGCESIEDWSPRFNVAPTTQMICFRHSTTGRELFPARWGLIPSWSKDARQAVSAINAKSETVATKPMFRSAFKSRRCVVVASGFYEWQKLGSKTKQPYYITLTSGLPMPFAGLWEWWRGEQGNEIVTCTICTTTANTMMAPFHDRMPVILPHALIDHWFDPAKSSTEDLLPILGQYPSDEMQAWPVSTEVGNVRNQGERLIEPIGE